jgi:nucleotide-binding universal stress UspA family protein
MRKVLVAIDDSPSSLKAVEYVAKHFAGIGIKDLEVGLAHVLPNLPAIFWDEGHILSEEEKMERRKVVDTWLGGRKAMMEPVFQKTVQMLVEKGMQASQIKTKFISDSTDAAESLLEEAKDFGYQTIVLGRSSRSAGKTSTMGIVASKVVMHGSSVAVTIVE